MGTLLLWKVFGKFCDRGVSAFSVQSQCSILREMTPTNPNLNGQSWGQSVPRERDSEEASTESIDMTQAQNFLTPEVLTTIDQVQEFIWEGDCLFMTPLIKLWNCVQERMEVSEWWRGMKIKWNILSPTAGLEPVQGRLGLVTSRMAGLVDFSWSSICIQALWFYVLLLWEVETYIF